jgi:hypothetical protein
MNNCIFTTHTTLTKEHAEYSLRSLLSNQTIPTVWNWFIIYNTHSHTIDNSWLQNKIKELDINGYIQNLAIFPYEEMNCPKTLTQDLINQFSMLIENKLNSPGKTLLLKSDYCVSRNFNKIFNKHTNINSIWSLPIYNAKSKVSQNEIDELCELPEFEITPISTYYRGGTNSPLTPGSLDNPYQEYSSNGKTDTDPSIKFVSHNIQNDYNLHVFTNDVLNICNQIVGMVLNPNATWGGAHDLFNVGFNQGGINRSTEIEAFGVHMYHSIKSENHKHERGDKRKIIEGEEY